MKTVGKVNKDLREMKKLSELNKNLMDCEMYCIAVFFMSLLSTWKLKNPKGFK